METNPGYLQEENINYKRYIYLFLSHWYWFALCIIIALTVAYFKNRYASTYYMATASLISEDDDQQQDVLSQFRSIRFLKNNIELQNESAKLRSYTLAHRTIEVLDFDVSYMGYGRIREKALYRNAGINVVFDTTHIQIEGTPVYINTINNSEYYLEIYKGKKIRMKYGQEYYDSNFKFTVFRDLNVSTYGKLSFTLHDKNRLANQYRAMLEIDASEKQSGTVITVKIKTDDAGKSVNYINTLCTEYIRFGLERKTQIAANTQDFLDNQIRAINDSLRMSERLMLLFKLNNDVVDLNKQGQIAFDNLKSYNQQKVELLFKLNYFDYLLKYINENKDPQNMLSPALVDGTNNSLTALTAELSNLYSKKEEFSYSAKIDNPSIEIINRKIASSKEQIIENITNSIQNTKNKIQLLEKQIAGISVEIKKLPVSEQELFNIERKYDINNKFYNFLLERRAETGIQRASTISTVRVLDEARIDNTQTIATKKSLVLLIAFFMGFLIPAVILILLDLINPTISYHEDIENNTKIPILGTIGHNYTDSDIPVQTDPRSPFAEAFRRIRTNLQYILRNKEDKVIMVTSTISGEGKTYITANLAAIMAMSNKKILLAGFDLRRPRLNTIFNIGNQVGISTFLIGKSTFDDIIFAVGVDNLWVAPSGPIPPNPAELLETDKMREFIATAKENFDYIIIDTPPIALVTDSLLIAEYSNANIFILRQKYTHKDVLELLNNLYESNKFKNLNILVNDVIVTQSLGYKYYYGYGYHYGYGYGYAYNGDKGYYGNSEKTDEESLVTRFKRWLRSDG